MIRVGLLEFFLYTVTVDYDLAVQNFVLEDNFVVFVMVLMETCGLGC